MTDQRESHHFFEALTVPDIRLFIGSVGFFTLASRALAVVIGFQIYQLTHSAMALGWLGLIEAIPAISIAPFGGYVSDHANRRTILLITRAVSCLCAITLAAISLRTSVSIIGLYAMIFLAGVARGFADPANTAFEAQVVPKILTVHAGSWIGSTMIASMFIGPAVIGFVFDFRGAAGSYLLIAAGFVLSWLCTLRIARRPTPAPAQREPMLKSIRIGWQYLFNSQPLWSSMTLDLFAVFFGGAIALLPIYASDILHVGARGLGLLNAAPSLGAALIMLYATRKPPIANAGRNLLVHVALFGVSILVFAFSRSFALSLAALFCSGIFDGVSMIIRRSIIRLLSPDELRGRIAAASSIFVCASNELGAFESGMGAAWLGTVPCVAIGGVLTITMVILATVYTRELRHLQFNVHSMERIPAGDTRAVQP